MSSIYWEGVKYLLTVEDYKGRVNTYTYYTQEALLEGIEKYKDQVISFNKVMNGILED